MSELDFAKLQSTIINEVKALQANVVSVEKYDESQNEVKKLKLILLEAEAKALNDSNQLKKLNLEHESLKKEHQMKMDVIKVRDERTQNTIKSSD